MNKPRNEYNTPALATRVSTDANTPARLSRHARLIGRVVFDASTLNGATFSRHQISACNLQ